jgi:hypothetical protein
LQQLDALPATTADLLQRRPNFCCDFARQRLFFVKDPAHLELYVEGLRRVGLS